MCSIVLCEEVKVAGSHEKVKMQDVHVDMDLINQAHNKIQSGWKFTGSHISLQNFVVPFHLSSIMSMS